MERSVSAALTVLLRKARRKQLLGAVFTERNAANAAFTEFMSIFKDKKIRNDILLAAAVILVAGGVWLFTTLNKAPGEYAAVIVNGVETARYPLDTDAEIRLESENGGYNILVIKDGKADITEASCPDKICVNQHAVSKTGEAITCLPNKTVVEIVGGEQEVDIVS